MMHDECLTFVEVRYRASTRYSPASHTVDLRKQQKIIRTAAIFVARNRRFSTCVMRFDVVAVEGEAEPCINWIVDAFRPNNSTL